MPPECSFLFSVEKNKGRQLITCRESFTLNLWLKSDLNDYKKMNVFNYSWLHCHVFFTSYIDIIQLIILRLFCWTSSGSPKFLFCVCKFNGVLDTLSTGKFKMPRDLDFFSFRKSLWSISQPLDCLIKWLLCLQQKHTSCRGSKCKRWYKV
jgi:hypothetical protein